MKPYGENVEGENLSRRSPRSCDGWECESGPPAMNWLPGRLPRAEAQNSQLLGLLARACWEILGDACRTGAARELLEAKQVALSC